MPEKNYVEMTLRFDPTKIEALKSQLRSAGCGAHISASEAIMKAVEQYQNWARSVRLDEPERKEVESRSGATVPLKSSKDILRAFDKLGGGDAAVTVELDPSVLDLMKDVGRGLGYGLSEFCKIVLEDSFTTSYMHTVELKPLFFKKSEWDALLLAVGCERIRSGGELLTAIRSLKTVEVDSDSHILEHLPVPNL